MSSSDYERYLTAIKAANNARDKETLRRIQKELIAMYGLRDRDAVNLLRQLRY